MYGFAVTILGAFWAHSGALRHFSRNNPALLPNFGNPASPAGPGFVHDRYRMSVSAQQLLDTVNDVLVKRLNGDAYESYSAHGKQFVGMSLAELYDLRTKLQNEINA